MKCDHVFPRFFHCMHYQEDRIDASIEEDPLKCPSCKSIEAFVKVKEKQFASSFAIAESQRRGESAKPDSYWANAEENRKKELNKRFNEEAEKTFYSGDSDKKTTKAKDDLVKNIKRDYKDKLEGGG